jgi:hypothetical protein
MVINENNSYINSFTKGMNSDQAYDQLQNTQYTYAKNVRITKNQSIGNEGDYPALREGIVTPVPQGKFIETFEIDENEEILAVKSVDNLGIIVSSNDHGDLIVRRIIDVENEPGAENSESYEIVWKSENFF